MTNIRKKKREQKKREAEANFFTTKVAFVAGIVLLITIIKDILELFISIPNYIVVCYLLICIGVFWEIVCTNRFDKILNSKGVSNFGNFLTVSSIIFFIIENTLIKFQYNHIIVILTVIILGSEIIGGALYLLFGKYEF